MDDFHGDPADKVILATTNCLGATLLGIKKTLSWGNLKHNKYLYK